jgi:hypothetical protein
MDSERSSHELTFSVGLLKEYWKKFDTLVVGQAMLSLTISQMPPWDDLCSELSWKTFSITSRPFSGRGYGHRGGVYRLIALAPNGSSIGPAVLNRICGQDKTGTLYIGEAGNLGARLDQMRRSFGREGSHGAINMLRKIPILNYSSNGLAVAVCFTNGKTRKLVEEHLIYAYINSLGEMPPLNYKSSARG